MGSAGSARSVAALEREDCNNMEMPDGCEEFCWVMGRKLRLVFLSVSGLLGVFLAMTNCSTSSTNKKPPPTILSPPPESQKEKAADTLPAPLHGCLKACFGEADFVLYPFAERVMAMGETPAEPRNWELGEAPSAALGPGSKNALAFRYLQGLHMFARGEHAEARVLFSELAPRYMEMASHAWYRSGLAAVHLKQWEDAANALSQVEAPFRFYADAQFLLARAYVQQKLFKEAIQTLEPLAQRPAGPYGRDVGAEALWQLHQIAEASRNKTLSQKALLQLWSEHPLHTLAAKANVSLSPKQLSLEAKVKRAETLIRLHRNEEGYQLLEKHASELKLPKPLACQATYVKGRALRKMRKHKAATEVFQSLLEQCKDSELQHLGGFNLIYSQSIVATERVFATVERFIQQFGTSSLADDVLISQARLWMRQGNFDKAMEALEQIIQNHSDGDMAMDALFLRFWYLRKQGHLQAAWEGAEALEKGARERNAAEDLWRALFWRGQLALEMGQEALGKQAWEQLLKEGPLSFYAERVRARHGTWESHYPKEQTSEYVFSQSSLQKFPAWASALELWKMGLWSEVAPELLSIPRAELDEEGLLLMAELLIQANASDTAFSVLRPLWFQGFHPHSRLARRYWVLAYPLAFRKEVEQATKAAGLPNPHLVQAVMREESACNPQALSWAGARGLLQLMPATAREVARKVGIKHLQVQSLMQPELNLKLGSTYLAGLLESFGQEPTYAIAAYNAGPNAVSRWKERNKAELLEEWIEDVPIDETRNYIKRVLSSFAIYQWLYPDFQTRDSNISAELLEILLFDVESAFKDKHSNGKAM
jgi:soluble lytic murein transglycosylase